MQHFQMFLPTQFIINIFQLSYVFFVPNSHKNYWNVKNSFGMLHTFQGCFDTLWQSSVYFTMLSPFIALQTSFSLNEIWKLIFGYKKVCLQTFNYVFHFIVLQEAYGCWGTGHSKSKPYRFHCSLWSFFFPLWPTTFGKFYRHCRSWPKIK